MVEPSNRVENGDDLKNSAVENFFEISISENFENDFSFSFYPDQTLELLWPVDENGPAERSDNGLAGISDNGLAGSFDNGPVEGSDNGPVGSFFDNGPGEGSASLPIADDNNNSQIDVSFTFGIGYGRIE